MYDCKHPEAHDTVFSQTDSACDIRVHEEPISVTLLGQDPYGYNSHYFTNISSRHYLYMDLNLLDEFCEFLLRMNKMWLLSLNGH